MRIPRWTTSATPARVDDGKSSTPAYNWSTTGDGFPTTTGDTPVACMIPAAIAPDVLGIRPPREANHGAIDVTSRLAPAHTAIHAATSLSYVNSGSAPISTAGTRSASSRLATATSAAR